ncbi:hypothetical protein DFQ28_010715 [Apophysomyces sp. BC1034]|nr:hypothetical protein DFQ30_010514 [Apophysomyces sp. BC1015]KAG0170391.1 hypothetical protein DFQ29_009309 [Apophysomyces sp. BC1021]KAG0184686.1 hypothetical protein DFQ28_010715 [Apophysomyces sp. BC1034]
MERPATSHTTTTTFSTSSLTPTYSSSSSTNVVATNTGFFASPTPTNNLSRDSRDDSSTILGPLLGILGILTLLITALLIFRKKQAAPPPVVQRRGRRGWGTNVYSWATDSNTTFSKPPPAYTPKEKSYMLESPPSPTKQQYAPQLAYTVSVLGDLSCYDRVSPSETLVDNAAVLDEKKRISFVHRPIQPYQAQLDMTGAAADEKEYPYPNAYLRPCPYSDNDVENRAMTPSSSFPALPNHIQLPMPSTEDEKQVHEP